MAREDIDESIARIDKIKREDAEFWDDHDRELALSFGHRPKGQEHRAWVDHVRLRAELRESDSWTKNMRFLGLADLNPKHPHMPAPLRALLKANEDPWSMWMGLVVIVGVYVVAVALMWPLQLPGGHFLIPLFPTLVLSPTIILTTTDLVHRLLCRLLGDPFPGTAAHARAAALDKLEQASFVVMLDDMLVENVPALSQLKGWSRELKEEKSAVESRMRDIEALRDRTRELLRSLGGDEADAHLTALTALLEREKALKRRIKATRAEVRERAALLEETLQELRQRAELEHVRRASSALTGAEPPTRDLAIEADLEVDMIGLVQEIGRLRVDLEEDRQRARALTEVSAG